MRPRLLAKRYQPVGPETAVRAPARPPSGNGVGAQHTDLLAVPAQGLDRLRRRAVVLATLEVHQEQVVAELALERARLDAHHVEPAEGQLRQAAHEPARRGVAGAVEDDRRLGRRAVW